MCRKGYGYPFRYKVFGTNEQSEGNRLWLAAVLYQSQPLRYDPVTILIFICQKWRIKIKIQLLLGSSRRFAHSAQRKRELVIPSAYGRLASDLTLQFRLKLFIHNYLMPIERNSSGEAVHLVYERLRNKKLGAGFNSK